MKKFTALLLAMVLFLSLCPVSGLAGEAGKIRVVTTIFPIYDWVREVAGDSENVELTLLPDSGVDLHSFETVIFPVKKTDELQLPAVLIIEGHDRRIAETVISSTASKDLKMLTLNSMQGTTASDIAQGASCLEIMEDNLAALKEALN